MKKISTYIWEHKFAYLLAVLSMIISISLDMLSPQLTKHIVDDVILGGNISLTLPVPRLWGKCEEDFLTISSP